MKRIGQDMIFSSPKSHKNRFDILEDIRDMLGFSEMEWKGLFHLVRKSSAGYACFTFRFGDYVLDLETDPDKKISFRVHKRVGARMRSFTYSYELADMTMPRRIEFGQ